MITLLGAGQPQNSLTLAYDWGFNNSLTSNEGVVLSHSRASRATYWGNDGYQKYADENSLLFSEDLDSVSWTKDSGTITSYLNDLPNVSAITKAWTFTETTTNTQHSVNQFFGECVVGKQYTFSGYAKDNGRSVYFGSNSAIFGSNEYAVFDLRTGIISFQASGANAQISSAGNGWYRCSVTLRCTGSGTAGSYFVTAPYGQTARVPQYAGDNISGFRITGTMANFGGLLPYVKTTTATYNGPRFEYDPITLLKRGLKIEPSATNIITGSQEYSGSYWSKNDATPSYTTETTDIGNNPTGAQKIVEGAAQAAFIESLAATSVASTSYCASWFIKRGNCDWVRLILQDGGGNSRLNAWFNINTGVAGQIQYINTANSGLTFVEKLPNGWYRIAVSGITGNYTTAKTTIVSAPADGNAARVNNAYYYLNGTQLEPGIYPSSYIYTRTSSVTRSADVLSLPLGVWYNQTEGSINIEYFNDYIDPLKYYTLLNISDGTANNRISIRSYNPSAPSQSLTTVVAGSGNSVTLSGGVNKTYYKSGFSWKQNQLSAVSNNGVVSTNSSQIPGNCNVLNLGSNLSSNETFNGCIKTVKYTNYKLADTTLKAMTV